MALKKRKGLPEIRGRLVAMLSLCPSPIRTAIAYRRLADAMHLDFDALKRRYAGGDNEWEILVRTAYKQLKDDGYAPKHTSLNHGLWSLTSAGQEYARIIEKKISGTLTLEDLGL